MYVLCMDVVIYYVVISFGEVAVLISGDDIGKSTRVFIGKVVSEFPRNTGVRKNTRMTMVTTSK